MSDERKVVEARIKRLKLRPSGNYGQTHPNMKHDGYYGPKTPFKRED